MPKIGPKEQQVRSLKAASCNIDHADPVSIPRDFCTVCTPRKRGEPKRAGDKPTDDGVTLAPPISQPQPEEDTMSRKKTTKTKTKRASKQKARSPVKAKTTAGPRKESKVALIASLLTRAGGCTTADVLKATGWPTVSMPQQAKAAGLTLKKEKDGSVTRYRAS